MIAKLAILSLALTLFSAPADAQVTLTATGKIEKLAKTLDCSKTATHRIMCTDIFLLGDTGVNLASWEGKLVDIEYALVPALCTTLKVTKIAAARYSLQISPLSGGKNRLGDRVRFRQTAPWLSIVPFVFSAKPGFVPLAEYGTLQCDIITLLYIKNDIALFGRVTNDIQIPNDKNLIGAFILTQGLYFTISATGATGKVLNVDCFKIISN